MMTRAIKIRLMRKMIMKMIMKIKTSNNNQIIQVVYPQNPKIFQNKIRFNLKNWSSIEKKKVFKKHPHKRKIKKKLKIFIKMLFKIKKIATIVKIVMVTMVTMGIMNNQVLRCQNSHKIEFKLICLLLLLYPLSCNNSYLNKYNVITLNLFLFKSF